MHTIAESDRFLVRDEGDAWLTLIRRGGDEMSLQARELPDLLALIERAEPLVRHPAGTVLERQATRLS